MEGEREQPIEEGEAAAPSGSTSRSTKHTSRIAIQKLIEVVAALSDYKRFLVEEIGFEGVLRIPMIQKINLKFSKFLMTKVVVEKHCIILRDGGTPITFYPEDFHKVFGIPCGQRDINGKDADITPKAIEFIRNSIGWNEKSDRSLSSLEAFIGKKINELSSRLEKDSFKMAFVVFVMGNLFAPCTKHDHSTIDYWGAIKDAENISLFNWCKYSVNFLLEAVRKLKLETDAHITPNHLSGCHLFLQAFVLDNVELGIMKADHNSTDKFIRRGDPETDDPHVLSKKARENHLHSPRGKTLECHVLHMAQLHKREACQEEINGAKC
ncbi:hypothetical protein CFC21_026758 [Triticum aestivum]|uniref:Aminotransferase-like plant mobile domain-containing protein n=2 Tax=Triticum aestivum TaxID=4565 RepID=A0A9R1EL97_WHEAT|nr:hypothetical protein CFC21_026758 [Triticum aestivum]